MSEVRSRRGTRLMGSPRIKLKIIIDTANRPHQPYNVKKLKPREPKQEFNCTWSSGLEALEDMPTKLLKQHPTLL